MPAAKRVTCFHSVDIIPLQSKFVPIIFCALIISTNAYSQDTNRPALLLSSKSMTEIHESNHISKESDKLKTVVFYDALKNSFERRNYGLEDLCNNQDAIGKRILEDYGAVFVAHESVLVPPTCMFRDAESVSSFQAQAGISAADFDGATIELQAAAMKTLLAARQEAKNAGLDITPRDGAEAARRSFDDTLRLWNSRFLPALKHWRKQRRLKIDEAKRLKNLPLGEQLAAILKLEEKGIFFSRDFSKSILYSVAPPGCSQHLLLLAFDANEFQNKTVREILARHGWFRTVQSDLPHFTFLGRAENELSLFGLKKLETADGEFWIPNV